MSWSDIPQGVRTITEDTRAELETISGVEAVSLYCSRSYADMIFHRNTQFNGEVYGIDTHYLNVYGYQVKSGRGFTERDYRNFRKVALVDTTAVTNLFGGEDPVGKTIEMQGEVFTVVGVVTLSEEFQPTINTLNDYWMYADTSAGSIFVPLAVWPTVYRFDEPQSVAIKVKNTDVMTSAGKDAADLLTQRQIMDPDNSEFDYRSQDMLEQAQQLQSMSESTNAQLIWIASISLLVGGIGVMNIMLVSVTERTSEIGLKKAIGAKKRRILWQFLTEAAVLTSLGGIIGVASGIGLAQLISQMMQIPVAIDVAAIAISVVFSMLIGVVFGLLPAVKAANLSPIEALRRV
jgi:putative ABC transport system permease protein